MLDVKRNTRRSLNENVTPFTNDAMLWNSFRQGDESALETIFYRFSAPMYNYGRKILDDHALIKDAIQDLFIELWRRRANLGETHFIKFYLLKSLRRKIVKIKTKEARTLFTDIDDDYDGEVVPSYEYIMVAEQQSQQEKDMLLRLLTQLTDRQREAIFLRYYEAQSYDDIAAAMDVNKQTVYNLIHEAIAHLRRAQTAMMSTSNR